MIYLSCLAVLHQMKHFHICSHEVLCKSHLEYVANSCDVTMSLVVVQSEPHCESVGGSIELLMAVSEMLQIKNSLCTLHQFKSHEIP